MGIVDERTALKHLLELHLTNHVAFRLAGAFVNTAYAVAGPMGVGKSTYAYYTAKAGYLKYLCYSHQLTKTDECAEHVLRKYDICIGGDCEEPDEIDEKLLKDSIFVGDEDIARLNDEIEAIALGKRERFKMLYLDDILVMGLYHMGGVYKQLYLWFTRNTQFIRTISKVLLLTTQSVDLIPRPLRKALMIIKAGANYTATNFTFNSVKVARLWYKGKLIPYRYYDTVWRDELPRSKLFKMPVWLEEKIEERKKKTILIYAQMLKEAIKREKERGTSPFAFLGDDEN